YQNVNRAGSRERAPCTLPAQLPGKLPNLYLRSGTFRSCVQCDSQGRTDNSWGPRAIGDHGAPVPLPKLKKAYEKGTRGISWGPLLTPRALGQCPSFQMVSPPL
ncbi:unnamed protein product, partial [Staurois parvus]